VDVAAVHPSRGTMGTAGTVRGAGAIRFNELLDLILPDRLLNSSQPATRCIVRVQRAQTIPVVRNSRNGM